jgi:predicted PurR-regulated permease PerM
MLGTSPAASGRVGAGPASGGLTTVLLAVVVVAALYFGRDVLMPVALAVLLSFVLAPLVRLLQRRYIPRSLAVVTVVLIAFAVILGAGALVVSQVNQLASDLPRYQSTLREKIQALRGAAAGTGTLERASEVLHELHKELDKPGSGAPSSSPFPGERRSSERPIPVEVRQPDPGALQTVAVLITPLVRPLTTTGIVVIFVIFILLQRQDLRNRLVRLAGAQDLQRTTAALDDAGQRLSRLFLMQLALNAGFGLVIAVGLWVIGVPNAPLWGMLAMILRFVPYIGAVIAAILPLVIAAAVGPGWTMVLWTALLFVIVEPLAGHVVEPLLFGHSTGLSPVAVIAAATFWTWLWGPIGLILATPLTVCLVVLGRHVDRLKFLDVMLGDQPPLTPAQLIYQRMLAGDPVEAVEQAETVLKEKPLIAYYDEVLIEGLKLAQADADRGLLGDEHMLRIRDAVAEIVDDLGAHKDKAEPPAETEAERAPLAEIAKAVAADRPAQGFRPRWSSGKPVLCIPGSGLLDEAMALIIAQLVEREGLGARAEQADALSVSRIFGLDTEDAALICLCYLENATAAQIRYAIRRLRRKAPTAFILVTLAGETSNIDGAEGLPTAEDIAIVKESLRTTVEKIFAAAASPTIEESAPALSRRSAALSPSSSAAGVGDRQ